jgi:phosphate butyryltransferase
MVTKAILHVTGAKFAGVVLGATHPIVMVSRSDTAEAKFNAIALAALSSLSA